MCGAGFVSRHPWAVPALIDHSALHPHPSEMAEIRCIGLSEALNSEYGGANISSFSRGHAACL